MNFRAEIDALPPEPKHPAVGAPTIALLRFWADLAYAQKERLALAARIHAEPHGEGCQIGGYKARDGQWERCVCTCGKDDAMREVLG